MDMKPILEHPSPDECFEIVQPTTIIVRKHYERGNFMILSDGTHHKFLKVRDTYWQLKDVSGSSPGLIEFDAKGCYNSDIAVAFAGHDISRRERVYRYFTRCWLANEQTLVPRNSIATPSNYRIANWSLGEDQLWDISGFEGPSSHLRTIAGITFASACYGGLHLIAWTSAFPSHVALVMWRAASVTLLATGPFCVAIAALIASVKWLDRDFLLEKLRLRVFLTCVIMCLIGSAVVWYTVCRTFIVVECFILLAHIPESALRVPTWAAYIPSFG
jgi:hypothetical protein